MTAIFKLLFFVLTFLNPKCQGAEETRVETLDSRYTVEWKVDRNVETVEFLVIANTTGWVGFGLSYNGKMTGADIVIGGVSSNGQTYFEDYHGIGNSRPLLDDEQNWELLEAVEENNVTSLRFQRQWDTCDEEDVFIDAGTLKLIWAIGETDEVAYHKDFKGALAINLLDPPHAPVNLTEVAYELTANYTLDGRETSYWCSIHKRESVNRTHIIAFNPKLETPEALKYVHHFNAYICKPPEGQSGDDFFKNWLNKDPEDCFGEGSSKLVYGPYCTLSVYAWSFGGRLLTLPDDVGFPWGDDHEEYFFIETHINNPDLVKNISVETGVLFYDTDVLRPKEAGLFQFSYPTTVSLFIPPHTKNWTIACHASPFCTNQLLPTDGIHLFNINLHAHVSATEMLFRHFRNGTELPWIGQDKHYDFDYQENRPLTENVNIRPGDQMTLECTFDSTWRQYPYPVIGGYPSIDEMCMVFAFYYPRIDVQLWTSGYDRDKLLNRYGIINSTENAETWPDMDPFIIEPEKWRGQKVTSVLNSTVNWTNEEKADLQKEILLGAQQDLCKLPTKEKVAVWDVAEFVRKKAKTFKQSYREVSYPHIEKEYSKPRNCLPKVPTTTLSTNDGNLKRFNSFYLLVSTLLIFMNYV